MKKTYHKRNLQLLTCLSLFSFLSQSPMINERRCQMFHTRVRSRLGLCITVILHTKNSIKRSALKLIRSNFISSTTKYGVHRNHRLLAMLMIEIVIVKSCHSFVSYNTARYARLRRSIIGGAQIGHASHLNH